MRLVYYFLTYLVLAVVTWRYVRRLTNDLDPGHRDDPEWQKLSHYFSSADFVRQSNEQLKPESLPAIKRWLLGGCVLAALLWIYWRQWALMHFVPIALLLWQPWLISLALIVLCVSLVERVFRHEARHGRDAKTERIRTLLPRLLPLMIPILAGVWGFAATFLLFYVWYVNLYSFEWSLWAFSLLFLLGALKLWLFVTDESAKQPMRRAFPVWSELIELGALAGVILASFELSLFGLSPPGWLPPELPWPLLLGCAAILLLTTVLMAYQRYRSGKAKD